MDGPDIFVKRPWWLVWSRSARAPRTLLPNPHSCLCGGAYLHHLFDVQGSGGIEEILAIVPMPLIGLMLTGNCNYHCQP